VLAAVDGVGRIDDGDVLAGAAVDDIAVASRLETRSELGPPFSVSLP